VDHRAAVGLGRGQGRRRRQPEPARAGVRPHAGRPARRRRVDTLIDAVNTDLDALHEAPLADPYVGPAILEGRAAGVFFHEVFGHRIEGHRQKDETSGQTFSSQVGKEIMPTWLSVYDDPTLTTLNGLQLNGFYRFDDEGVRAPSGPPGRLTASWSAS
jgi:predicted Zn-dependent protease